MRIDQLVVENVRSYGDQTAFRFDGQLNILIGPNGGGKTNLLDVLSLVFSGFVLQWYKHDARSDRLNIESLFGDLENELSKYDKKRESMVRLILIPDSSDVQNILRIRSGLTIPDTWSVTPLKEITDIPNEHLELFSSGHELRYEVVDGVFRQPSKGDLEYSFLVYTRSIQLVLMKMGDERSLGLSVPVLYQTSIRTSAIAKAISINDEARDQYFQNYANIIRKNNRGWGSLVAQHFAHLKQKAIDRQIAEGADAEELFESYQEVQLARKYLSMLGYDFRIIRDRPSITKFQMEYFKENKKIDPDRFSSGEREIFDFLFGIVSTNVRDGVIIVDEPELHLHPKWQGVLLSLYEDLSKDRNLQLIISTHSPVFVTHHTIDAVTRIYQREGKSQRASISAEALPEQKHLVRIVNSHNNERIFFADRVILVEGIMDRLVFENLIRKFGRYSTTQETIEVIEVHGKHNFEQYRKICQEIKLPFCLIADLDYLFDIAKDNICDFFSVDYDKIDTKVLGDKKSKDRISLAKEIEFTIKNKNFDLLEQLWIHIKSRFSRFRPNLTEIDRAKLEEFIQDRANEGVYILHNGEIEDYLPENARRLEGLLVLIEDDEWICRIGDPMARSELIEITLDVLGLSQSECAEVRASYSDSIIGGLRNQE